MNDYKLCLNFYTDVLNTKLGGYQIAPIDTYFPVTPNVDNSLSLIQRMPNNSLGFICLLGDNVRMGLEGIGGTATYIFFKERGEYGAIIAITLQGIKIEYIAMVRFMSGNDDFIIQVEAIPNLQTLL